MSSTPIERHQPERTKNEGPTTTTMQQRLLHGVRFAVVHGSTQPVELVEEINGLEGTEFAPGTCRTIGGRQESTYELSKLHADRTTPEDLHGTTFSTPTTRRLSQYYCPAGQSMRKYDVNSHLVARPSVKKTLQSDV